MQCRMMFGCSYMCMCLCESEHAYTVCCLPMVARGLFGCPVLAVLVLDSGTWLDIWRAVPVRTNPGYVREMR